MHPVIMPRYEYNCKDKKCETKVFEEIQSFSDKPKARCPECKKLTNKRKDFYAFSHQWSHDARNDHLFP